VPHEVALSCYSNLFRTATGLNETDLEIRTLIKTKQPKIEIHRYPRRSDNQFQRMFALLPEYLDEIDAGCFNYRPGWNCGLCDFRAGQCHAWKD